MSNRSYLYSIDFDPAERAKNETDKIKALSEYSSYVPFAYQVMISADAKLCRSLIWDHEHPIAVLADFEKGRKRLYNFLAAIEKTEAFDKGRFAAEVEKTKAFLNDPANGAKYLLLELGEIFEFGDEPFEKQAADFINELQHIEKTVRNYLDELAKKKKEKEDLELGIKINESGTFKFVFRKYAGMRKEENAEKLRKLNDEMWWELGIDNWQNILYYDFQSEEDSFQGNGDFGTLITALKKDGSVVSEAERETLSAKLKEIIHQGQYESADGETFGYDFQEVSGGDNTLLAKLIAHYYGDEPDDENESAFEFIEETERPDAEEIVAKLKQHFPAYDFQCSVEEW